MDKEDKQIINRAIKENWRIGDRTRLKRLLEKNLKLYRENVELERKLEQTEKDLADYQFNYPTIKELEKENAELKAGRVKWHDLRKDPTDLPPKMVSNHNFSIEVLSDKGEIVCYNFHYCEWFYWRSGEPIAWCEIPTFEEE